MYQPRPDRPTRLFPGQQPPNVSPIGPESLNFPPPKLGLWTPTPEPQPQMQLEQEMPMHYGNARSVSAFLQPLPPNMRNLEINQAGNGYSHETTSFHAAQIQALFAQEMQLQQQIQLLQQQTHFYQQQVNRPPPNTGGYGHETPHSQQAKRHPPASYSDNYTPSSHVHWGHGFSDAQNFRSRSAARPGHEYDIVIIEDHSSAILGNVGYNPNSKFHKYKEVKVKKSGSIVLGDMSTPAYREHGKHPPRAGETRYTDAHQQEHPQEGDSEKPPKTL